MALHIETFAAVAPRARGEGGPGKEGKGPMRCLPLLLLVSAAAQGGEPFGGFETVPEVGPPPELRPKKAVEMEAPFVSIIGNVSADFSGERWVSDRNRVVLERAELALQSWLYPSIRGEAFIVFRREPGTGEVKVEAYEVYGKFLKLGKGLGGVAGRFRPHIGFLNRLHPHHRPFADLPEVLSGLFGPEGLGVEGLSLAKSLGGGLSVEAGAWREWSEGGLLGLPGRTTYSVGLSGRAGGPVRFSLHGLRREGGGHAVWLAIWRERALGEADWALEAAYGRRPGGGFVRGLYAFAKRDVGEGWWAGLRADYLREPAGEHKGASLLASRQISPTVSLVLQAKYTDRPRDSGFEFLTWLSWGIGPYAHSLEFAERIMESVPKEVPK